VNLKEEATGIEVGLVEFVRHSPPDGTELAPLLRYAASARAREREGRIPMIKILYLAAARACSLCEKQHAPACQIRMSALQ
jgi:hypothetical protein